MTMDFGNISTRNECGSIIERLITKKQLSIELGVSGRTINNLMAKYGLPFVRVGRSVRFNRRKVEAWLANPFCQYEEEAIAGLPGTSENPRGVL
jgi:excisionase family DNA binding protein